MYDELLAELRMHHCDAKEDDTQEVCEECAYDVIIADKSVPSGIASVCVCGLMHRAADAIEELSKQHETQRNNLIALLNDKPRWTPVEERLPDNGKYLVSINTIPPHQIIEVCSFAKDLYKIDKYDFRDKKRKSGFYGCDGEYGYFERTGITHWMPLPEPPKGDE